MPANSPTNVGIMIDPIGTFGRGVTRGVLAYQRYQQWQLSMLRTWIFQPASFIEQWDGDGLIVMIPDEPTEQIINQLGKPVVCVSSILPDLFHTSVLADDYAIGRMAAQHFLDRGFRHFAFVGHSDLPVLSHFVSERGRGFAEGVKAADYHVQSISDLDDIPKLLKSLRLPAALFAANDEYAIKTIAIAENMGLKVPEQIAVLGVDNDDLLVEASHVSLSSIDVPTFKIGFEAARLLDQILKGDNPDQTMIKFPPLGPVTRKSTDITAIADDNITAALAFIRQHAADPLSVSDVLLHVPISRRVLERRFQQYLQRSVYEEIQRVHIERACRLLIDTNLPIAEVGEASGFSGRARFHATFAKAMNHTPKKYRDLNQNDEV
ncbi:MAG TPA: hypothetical protein DCM28_12775 [Phycisphaerales bacterium]|nr:hypothetical protein [Phycisphaerales bacterium]HCD34415.1 hypothetical protein [Phycisphaerales bacterium]